MTGIDVVRPLRYWLDSADTIVRVSDDWDAVARAGGGVCLEQSVLGCSLWSFVDGASTQVVLARLLAWVRDTGEPLRCAYRCDTAELRRLCEQTLTPGGAGTVAVSHRFVRIDPWPRPVRVRRAAGGQHVRRCSLCNRVRAGDGWLDVSRAIALGHIDAEPAVVYTVCDDCKRAVDDELARRAPARAARGASPAWAARAG
jgi:hypothetical protein